MKTTNCAKTVKVSEVLSIISDKIDIYTAKQELFTEGKKQGIKGKNYTTELTALKSAYRFVNYLTSFVNNNIVLETWNNNNLGVIFEQLIRLYFSSNHSKYRKLHLAKSKNFDTKINGEYIEIKAYIQNAPHSWNEDGIKTSKNVIVYVAIDNALYYIDKQDLINSCNYSKSKGYTLTLSGIRKYGKKSQLFN